jgi:hypothetical protein
MAEDTISGAEQSLISRQQRSIIPGTGLNRTPTNA